MELQICNIIKQKRAEMNVNQETLAQALGVTVQAVSKWETEKSLPDISLLPLIAEYFGIDMNELFFGESAGKYPLALPDDGKLRVLQALGRRLLSAEECVGDRKIPLAMPDDLHDTTLQVLIQGGADMKGDVSGSVAAQGGVNCGDVSGGVSAGGGVNCGDIMGGVSAGGGVNCGDINGCVDADGGINCGDICGGVSARGDISCGDISGSAESGRDIRAKTIENNASAQNRIICGGIGGNAESPEIVYADKGEVMKYVKE